MDNQDILLEGLVEEYLDECVRKGYPKKTLLSKQQLLSTFLKFLAEKRAVTELGQFDIYCVKAYQLFKQKSGLKSNSIRTVWKIIHAWNSWLVKKDTWIKILQRKSNFLVFLNK